MLAWLSQNWGSLLVGAVLLLVVGAAAVSLWRKRKASPGGCGCGCAHCPMHESCKK